MALQNDLSAQAQATSTVAVAIVCGNCNFPIAYIKVVVVRKDIGSNFFFRRHSGEVRHEVLEHTDYCVYYFSET